MSGDRQGGRYVGIGTAFGVLSRLIAQTAAFLHGRSQCIAYVGTEPSLQPHAQGCIWPEAQRHFHVEPNTDQSDVAVPCFVISIKVILRCCGRTRLVQPDSAISFSWDFKGSSCGFSLHNCVGARVCVPKSEIQS